MLEKEINYDPGMWSKEILCAVILGVSLLMWGLGYWVGLNPAVRELKMARRQISVLQQQALQFSHRRVELNAMKKQQQSIQKRYKTILLTLNKKFIFENFAHQMIQTAKAHQILIERVTPETLKLVSRKNIESIDAISIETSGSYYAMLDFLRDLQQFNWFMKIKKIQIHSGGDTKQNKLQMQFLLEIYEPKER